MGGDPPQDAGSPFRQASVRAFLDTNILVRHLTGEPSEMAQRATAFLASGHELFLADVVVAELVYVLESFYEVPRREVADLARSVAGLDGVTVDDQRILGRALDVYEHDRLDFAEAYFVARAESSGVAALASFDRSIDRVNTVDRVEP